MPDSPVLDVAIGLALVFGIVAGLTSALTEAISRWLGLRADYLLRGIRSLVLGEAMPSTDKRATIPNGSAQEQSRDFMQTLLSDGVVSSQGAAKVGALTAGAAQVARSELRAMPAYLSSRAFAQAVVSYLLPDPTGDTEFTDLEATIATIPAPFGPALRTLARNADGNVANLRTLIEHWYDDHMQRVSGWYKRHVRWFSLACGAILVVLFNVNAIGIAQSLYSDQNLRAAVVTEAFAAAPCPPSVPNSADTTANAANCLKKAHDEITKISGIGIPLGWSGAQRPSSDAGAWALRALGWLLTALALTLGARFWFDALSRLGSLRSTGDKPSPSI
jgi:hypothetical protein